MILRIGEVTQVFPNEGKVQVLYTDTDNTSLPLPLVTYNNEYSMPAVGDEVVTLHFQNGSSKAVCLGTYYGNGNTPKTNKGYRKDFEKQSYLESKDNKIKLDAKEIGFTCSYGTITVEDIIKRIERLERLIT